VALERAAAATEASGTVRFAAPPEGAPWDPRITKRVGFPGS
jgi:hypothetical protein